MTILYTKAGGRPQPLPAADTRVSDGWLLTPLDGHPDAIAACGWTEAPAAPAIDVNTQALGWDGTAWTVEPLAGAALEQRRLARRRDVDQRAQAAFLAGFVPAHAAFAGERLQVRDAEDRTNWLTSQAGYAAAVERGFGDVVDASFRTAANRTVTVTYAEGLDVLLAMAGWGRSIVARAWALKDAIDAGGPIDIDAGWPA